MDSSQLLEYIIKPSLQTLDLYSYEASILLLATAAQESQGGYYIKQLGGGPARGIFQMETETHDDIYDNFLVYRPELLNKFKPLLLPFWDKSQQLIVNPLYASAMARVHYYRVSDPLPQVGMEEMWPYYKEFYNTSLGAATEEEWLQKRSGSRTGIDTLSLLFNFIPGTKKPPWELIFPLGVFLWVRVIEALET
jgi:hypothetical protein